MLCLIFLLNIHFTALKFVPVFYKSMHLPIVQFSWHGLGSSDYTKQGYFSARAWVYEHWSFDIWIWLNCGVPRDSRSWSGTNCLSLTTMDSIWSSSHRYKLRHKRPRYYKTPVAYYSNFIAIQRLVQTATSSTQKSKEKTNAKRNITKFDCCEKTIRRNQASITCCGCIGSFLKCSGLTASSSTWLCSNCLGFAQPLYKCSDVEMLDDTLDLSTSLDPGLDIHLLCSNSGQLKIMHLNTQSMVLTFNELLLTVNSYPLA